MARRHQARIIFVTGTDTGVGKTLLTALLLHHLRQKSHHALAIKPFSSGSLRDVRILSAIQHRELSFSDICPFYFPEPLAPLVAARLRGRAISFGSVTAHIRRIARRCDILLVEGAGGMLAPLGEGFTARELSAAIQSEVILVSTNKLGTINHTSLSLEALNRIVPGRVSIVMMNSWKRDPSAQSNPRVLSELARPIQVHTVPNLGPKCLTISGVKKNEKKVKKVLASILA